jgi:hypothetical protein
MWILITKYLTYIMILSRFWNCDMKLLRICTCVNSVLESLFPCG